MSGRVRFVVAMMIVRFATVIALVVVMLVVVVAGSEERVEDRNQ